MNPRRNALLAGLAICALGLLGAAPASASTSWNLDAHHNETNFPPGGTAQLWFDLNNVGDTDSAGAITLTVNLLGGLTRNSITNLGTTNAGSSWSCPGAPGATTLTCTTAGPVSRHSLNRNLIVKVNVPSTPGDRFVTAKVQGGGAPTQATTLETIHVTPEPAGFGIVPESFTPDFLEDDSATPVRSAGSHPPLLVVPFDFNSIALPSAINPDQKAASDSVRDLVVDLPPGFIGNPTAVAECTPAELSFAECPRASQVGRIDLAVTRIAGESFRVLSVGVFNMVHPRGAVSDLAFTFAGIPVHIEASLDPGNQYAIRTTVSDINETIPAFNQRLTIWGVPGAESHDAERCHLGGSEEIDISSENCSTGLEPRPFLAVPSQCESDSVMRLHHYDSWQDTGVFGPEIIHTLPGLMSECEKPRFKPEVEIEPTGKQANTPTGLDVHVKIAQNENPNALATPPVKRFTVRLPEGMSFSPSFADGLRSCTLAQMQLGNNEPVQCPNASRIGEVTLHTPLLPQSAEGSMYLAAQGDNPFGSTFALLLVLEDTEERGALVKIPGKVEVDETTGRITTVFNDSPQFPFDDLTLKFRSGSRAPLVSPPTCGTQTIGVEVASYAQPQSPVDVSNTYEVTEGPNGTPCPNGGTRSFSPEFDAGTLNPVAGAYSPFLFELSREDQEQELAGVKTVLPPGLVGKIAGVSLCPEQAIASIPTAEFTGRSEQVNPACPSSSQIGSISAGLGAGPGPNYFPGKVYLAGPYKGAKLSLAVVAPALAGPFDLGNVVVRAALYVNPDTAQVTAVSDPFPTILHGVILRVRDVRLSVDRPNTTINPTNCARMAIGGEVTSTAGALFNTASPFQVGSCSDLSFKPKLDLRLFGGTHRGSHPKLKATVRFPAGGANTAAASVALPHSEFLDQGHIGTVCTRPQFAADACPAASIYGTVSAKTPLLDEELKGNIYLKSSSHQLPDLVAAFRGGRIDANLVGRIDSVNGGIRNTFEFVPDVPVTSASFAFFGGSKGLLVNSRDICKAPARATAKFTGQNGAQLTLHPQLKSACAKAKKKAKAKRTKHRQR